MKRGFTVVEILITLVIISILLTLGVVSMRGVQANARDKERQVDIETIARGLERRYKEGNPVVTSASGNEAKAGSYPGVNEMEHMRGQSRSAQGYVPAQVTEGYYTEGLPGVSAGALASPNAPNALVLVCYFSCSPAGNTTQINNAFAGLDRYVYEPVSTTGQVCCCGDCPAFNLYWRSEVDGAIKTYKSKFR